MVFQLQLLWSYEPSNDMPSLISPSYNLPQLFSEDKRLNNIELFCDLTEMLFFGTNSRLLWRYFDFSLQIISGFSLFFDGITLLSFSTSCPSCPSLPSYDTDLSWKKKSTNCEVSSIQNYFLKICREMPVQFWPTATNPSSFLTLLDDVMLLINLILVYAHPAFTCSKSTTETLEQGLKYVQSEQ